MRFNAENCGHRFQRVFPSVVKVYAVLGGEQVYAFDLALSISLNARSFLSRALRISMTIINTEQHGLRRRRGAYPILTSVRDSAVNITVSRNASLKRVGRVPVETLI